MIDDPVRDEGMGRVGQLLHGGSEVVTYRVPSLAALETSIGSQEPISLKFPNSRWLSHVLP